MNNQCNSRQYCLHCFEPCPELAQKLLAGARQVREVVRTIKLSNRTPAIQMLDVAVDKFINKYSDYHCDEGEDNNYQNAA